VSDPDFSTWLTKDQAAAAIGVSTKTIEQFSKDGKIQQSAWRPHGRGAERAVYNPDDVARMAQERRPGLPPFVLPANHGTTTNGNGHGGAMQMSNSITPSGEDVLRLVFAAALRALAAEPPTSENSQKSTPWVDIPTAATLLGRSQAYVRREIKAGRLHAERDRCLVVKRKDVEAL
jgi:hypothetical protein